MTLRAYGAPAGARRVGPAARPADAPHDYDVEILPSSQFAKRAALVDSPAAFVRPPQTKPGAWSITRLVVLAEVIAPPADHL
jgi:hypothetical protein